MQTTRQHSIVTCKCGYSENVLSGVTLLKGIRHCGKVTSLSFASPDMATFLKKAGKDSLLTGAETNKIVRLRMK